ncbi:hypothetical protein MJH12_05710 [bacterium]|nr:hypothetical protein [bacterium]
MKQKRQRKAHFVIIKETLTLYPQNHMVQTRINCIRCKYYKVTWEVDRPHSCTLFAFKSKALPMHVVRQSDGNPCQGYRLKKIK